MPDLALRLAQQSDVPLLKEWDEQPHVRAVSGDDGSWDWALEIDQTWQEVWIAEVTRHPVGVVILMDAAQDPSHYWGDVAYGTFAIDIWIGDPLYLRRGFGTSMMLQTIKRAFESFAARRIVIDPLITNGSAITFYRRLGFVEVGPRRFGTDDCLVLELRRC